MGVQVDWVGMGKALLSLCYHTKYVDEGKVVNEAK